MDIGDIRTMTGISNSGIRFLEDEGICRPVRNEKSGYRSYSHDDALLINTYIGYRNAGLELSTIKELMGADPSGVSAGIEESVERLRAELDRKIKCAQYQRRLLDLADRVGYASIDKRPRLVVIPFNPDDVPAKAGRTDIERDLQPWHDWLPIVTPGILWDPSAEGHRPVRGMVAEYDVLVGLDIPAPPYAHELPSRRRCAHIVFAYTSATPDVEAMQSVVSTALRLKPRLKVAGLVAGRLLHARTDSGGTVGYRAEYWVPLD